MDIQNTRKRCLNTGAFRRNKKRIMESFLSIPTTSSIIEPMNEENFGDNELKTSDDVISSIHSESDAVDSSDSSLILNEESDQLIDAKLITEKSGEFDKKEFLNGLRQWALTSDVNHTQLRGLLQLWNKSIPLHPLPVDPRTILQTPRHVDLRGNYWHYGLRKVLDVLKHVKVENMPDKISLRFNMDGIPISKSSSTEAWPILVDIEELKYIRPCVVGIYCGAGK